MASIWITTKTQDRKIVGHLEIGAALARLVNEVGKEAKRISGGHTGAEMRKVSPSEIFLSVPGRSPRLVYVEFGSPPSAPEPNQPTITRRSEKGFPKGVIVRSDGAHSIGAGAAA